MTDNHFLWGSECKNRPPFNDVKVRQAIAYFRGKGKFAIGFAESLGSGGTHFSDYYLASALEQIWLQPSGGFAVAHNGNISNAMTLRRDLNRRGSIFQSTSDTEVIIHLVATSEKASPMDRLIDALKQVEGAYSLLVLTEEGLIACRDPLGIRPLVMGKLGEATIFVSP